LSHTAPEGPNGNLRPRHIFARLLAPTRQWPQGKGPGVTSSCHIRDWDLEGALST